MNNTGGAVNVEERVGYKWWRWNWRPIETTLFLMIAWIGYFTGAASSGAALFIWSRSAAAAIPLAKPVSQIPGTMVIFDYHDDYRGLRIRNANLIPAKINPRLVSVDKFADVIEIKDIADIQKTILSKAFDDVFDSINAFF